MSSLINTLVGFALFLVVLFSSVFLWKKARKVLHPDKNPDSGPSDSLNDLLGYDFIRIVDMTQQTQEVEEVPPEEPVQTPVVTNTKERNFAAAAVDEEGEEEEWPIDEDIEAFEPKTKADDAYMDWMIGAEEDDYNDSGESGEGEDEDQPEEHYDPRPTDEDYEISGKTGGDFENFMQED